MSVKINSSELDPGLAATYMSKEGWEIQTLTKSTSVHWMFYYSRINNSVTTDNHLSQKFSEGVVKEIASGLNQLLTYCNMQSWESK